jgi:hypothetical protein
MKIPYFTHAQAGLFAPQSKHFPFGPTRKDISNSSASMDAIFDFPLVAGVR